VISHFPAFVLRCGGGHLTLMKHHLRRFLNKDILSSIPPGVNPFKHLIDLAEPAMSYSLSSFSKLILWVLFVLHCLVVLFCLVVLALLYRRGAKQFLWLVKRLNIEDRNGKNGVSIIVIRILDFCLFNRALSSYSPPIRGQYQCLDPHHTVCGVPGLTRLHCPGYQEGTN
jgi:hypothetical protein